jgi:hypothetical protein
VVEQVDTADLKSASGQPECRLESGRGRQFSQNHDNSKFEEIGEIFHSLGWRRGVIDIPIEPACFVGSNPIKGMHDENDTFVDQDAKWFKANQRHRP